MLSSHSFRSIDLFAGLLRKVDKIIRTHILSFSLYREGGLVFDREGLREGCNFS